MLEVDYAFYGTMSSPPSDFVPFSQTVGVYKEEESERGAIHILTDVT